MTACVLARAVEALIFNASVNALIRHH